MRFFCLIQPFAPEALALFIFEAFFLSTFVTAICYYPDQSMTFQDVPCSDEGEHSNCCGPGYACLSNKVCRQSHEDADGAPLPFTYGRGSCTDRTWRSSACPSFCLIGQSRKHSSMFAAQIGFTDRSRAVLGMDNCDQTTEHTYCCGTLNGTQTQDVEDGVDGICDCNAVRGPGQPLRFEGNATAITTIGVTDSSASQTSSTSQNLVVSSIDSASSRPSSSSVSSSASASTLKARQSLTISEPLEASSKSPVASSSPIPQPTKNRAVIIGATVGVTVSVVSVAALAFFFCGSKRKTRGPLPETRQNEYPTQLHNGPDRPHELLASTGEQELLGSLNYHELPADSRHK